jgi:hypothetical protein
MVLVRCNLTAEKGFGEFGCIVWGNLGCGGTSGSDVELEIWSERSRTSCQRNGVNVGLQGKSWVEIESKGRPGKWKKSTSKE